MPPGGLAGVIWPPRAQGAVRPSGADIDAATIGAGVQS